MLVRIRATNLEKRETLFSSSGTALFLCNPASEVLVLSYFSGHFSIAYTGINECILDYLANYCLGGLFYGCQALALRFFKKLEYPFPPPLSISTILRFLGRPVGSAGRLV